MPSFASAHPISITTKHQSAPVSSVQPYDSTLAFNKIIDQKPGNAETIIYSIDANRFLRVLDSDDFSPLEKITLACRPVQQTAGMWDTLFNSNMHRPVTACVLVAQNDFTPIPRARVASQSTFLDLTRAWTRLYLNRLVKGDQVGIAIRNPMTGFTHILLYVVEDFVSIRKAVDNGDAPSLLIPAVNVVLEHVIRLDHSNPGTAEQLQMGEGEYDHEKAGPFVTWLADTVYDIPNSYAWKPHFLPFQPKSFKRDELEAEVNEAIEKAPAVSFAEFEDLCRSAYQTAKANRPPRDNTPPPQQGKNRKRPKARDRQNELPVVKIFTVGDTYYADVPGSSDIVKFTTEDLGGQAIAETHLTNQDLANVKIEESSLVMMLAPSYGDGAYVRYFTINF